MDKIELCQTTKKYNKATKLCTVDEKNCVCVLKLLAVYDAVLINSVQMGCYPAESFVVHNW